MWSIDLVRRRMRRSSARGCDEAREKKNAQTHQCTNAQRSAQLQATVKRNSNQITRSPDGRITKFPPILLTETKANRDLVVACCEVCLDAGVKPGMTLAHARALLPSTGGGGEPHVETHAPARNLDALRAIAHWAVRFTPIVALDPPDGLLLDITGCARLHRGERRLINRIADSIQRLGFRVRIASAPTFACARAVARAGRRQRSYVSEDRVREALAPLPVCALGIDEEAEDGLREIAIDRIGHLFDLPRSSLPARFGDELLLRLDQALGQAIETMDPVRPAPPPEVERLFNGPVSQLEAIEITVRELLEELARELLHRESGVRDLRLTLDRSDLDPLHISIALSHPSRNVKHLWSLLSPHVERAHMGFGVERVSLCAQKIDRLPHEQLETRHGDTPGKARRHEGARGELFDTLINRLGRESILRLEPVESHNPERAFRMVSVMQEAQRHKGTEARRERRRDPPRRVNCEKKLTDGLAQRRRSALLRTPDHQITRSPDHQISITPHDRPTILFNHPEPIDVLAVTPESPPSRLTWRAHSYEVLCGCGPERIGEVWWEEEGAKGLRNQGTKGLREDQKCSAARPFAPLSLGPLVPSPLILLQRSYYRVLLDDGRFLWVFRHLLTGRWFVHGQWV
jgi:protein ImuB